MSTYFVDTSAIAKRYIPEVGSLWVASWITPAAGNIIIISRLSTVEMVSVLARRQREGNIAVLDRIRLQNDFLVHVDKQQFMVIEPNNTVLNTARDLLIKYPLRTLDAIQLSSALQADLTLSIHPTFVTADIRLLTAASSEGLPTDNPIAHQ